MSNEIIEVETIKEVDYVSKIDVIIDSKPDVTYKAPEYEVSVNRKHYNVVGDEIYIPKLYDDAPQWMKDIIGNVVDVKTAIATGNLNDALEALKTLASELNVAKNTYTNSVISSNDIDTRITTAIESLNSSLRDADATILNIAQTAVTPSEASAIVANVLSASLNPSSGTIGSKIANLESVFSNLKSTTAQSINYMESAISKEFEGNAEAFQTLRTYVGIAEDGGITGTGLLANVSLLQKQNDGIIEVVTGTYDVMSGIEDPNTNTDNDGLVTTALPYANWIPRSGNVDPSGNDFQYRVYRNNVTNKCFMYSGTRWDEISDEEYSLKEDFLRSIHVGDVYIMYSSSTEGYKTYVRAYKFIKTAIDSTSPYATDDKGYTWSVIVDTDAQNAYIAALNAYDLADNKRRVFVTTPTAPYDIGDLWIRVVDGSNQIWRASASSISSYSIAHWSLASTDDSAAIAIRTGATKITLSQHIDDKNWDNRLTGVEDELANYIDIFTNDISELETQLDGVGVTYFQNERPYLATAGTSINNGDIWFDTNRTPNYAERFSYINGVGSWNSITNVNTLNALKVASDTKAAADGVIHTYVQTTEPTLKVGLGDIWFNSNSTAGAKEIYTYVGTGGSHYSGRWNKVGTFVNTTIGLDLSQAMIGTKNIATYVAEEIDKEVVVYSGTTADKTALTGMKVNDIFIEKTTATGASGVIVDVVNTYKYSGTVWTQIGNNTNLTALADLADGKRTIFSNDTSMPVNPKVRDMWIPANNYLTYTKGEIYLYNGTLWVVATKYSADIAAITSNVQSQIDSKVDTYYQATVPYANATNVARRTTGGDYWYCTNTANGYIQGKMYKYVETPNGSNWNYTWTETADVTKYAFDKADSKAAIYTTAAKPNTYNVRDMLIVLTDNAVGTYSAGVVLTATATRTSGVFTASEWTKQINDTEDLDNFIDDIYDPTIATLQNQSDGTIEYYYYPGTGAANEASTLAAKLATWNTQALKENHNGDVVYFKDTTNGYWYSSKLNAWQSISDTSILKALKVAENAQATADGIVVSFYAVEQSASDGIDTAKFKYWYNGTTLSFYNGSAWVAKSGLHIGDTLTTYITTTKDTKVYTYSGSLWYTQTANGIVASSEAVTSLSSRLNTAEGTIGAHTTELSTVSTRINAEGARVESNWAYNSNIKIGSYTYNSGFGLATSATSGSGLTTGQSEFWIKADKFKLMSADGTKKSSYSPFSVDTATGDITFNGKVSFNNVNGVPVINTNLIHEDWTTGSGSTDIYNSNGLESENYRVYGDNHSGQRVILWECRSDGLNDGSGGWNTDLVKIDNSKTYRFSVFVKKNSNNGHVYFGCDPDRTAVLNTNTSDTNPYFWYGSLPTLNEWYLLVGYIYPAGQTGLTTKGGIYSCTTGKKVANINQDFNFKVGSTNTFHRCYNYYDTTTTTRQWMWNARIEEVNGREPSILDLINTTNVGNTSAEVVADINNGNTTTINGGRITTRSLTANQINVNSLFAQDIAFTGTITGGSGGLGGKIKSYNGNMEIDLVNGSIYIA